MLDISYAKNTGHWEHWWPQYQFGAFYIFPPEEIMVLVDGLREQYDPKSAGICRAHISLSEPLDHPMTIEELEQLRSDLAGFKPFRISCGPIRMHPPYPGVTFTIQPEREFSELRSRIHGLPVFRDVEIKRSTIDPHMTIAEFITMERSIEIMEELQDKIPNCEFICDHIELAVPNDDFYFERVLRVTLGAGG